MSFNDLLKQFPNGITINQSRYTEDMVSSIVDTSNQRMAQINKKIIDDNNRKEQKQTELLEAVKASISVKNTAP